MLNCIYDSTVMLLPIEFEANPQRTKRSLGVINRAKRHASMREHPQGRNTSELLYFAYVVKKLHNDICNHTGNQNNNNVG